MSAMSWVKRLAHRHLSDAMHVQALVNYRRIRYGLMPRWVNLRNPERFTDKVLWLKLFRTPNDASVLVDKFRVRDHVSRLVGSDILIPLAAVYDDPHLIDIEDFPERFVLKPNNASGRVIFGKRDQVNLQEIITQCCDWMSVDYGGESRERQYSDIARKILVEQDIRTEVNDGALVDYKFYCFNGVPTYVQVIMGRQGETQQVFLDMDWVRQPFRTQFPLWEEQVKRPKGFERMREVAAILSSGLPFARIDLYNVNGRVFFGEITLHPSGGGGPVLPDAYDFEIGKLLKI